MTKTTIEWTEHTWNPVAGCTVLMEGCTNCYAMRMAARLEAMGQVKYSGTTRKSGGRAKWTGQVNLDRNALQQPFAWRKPRLVFVNSMSGLFHDAVPTSFIEEVFDVMANTPLHTYQVLTKRADRLAEVGEQLDWPANVWMGVSVESQDVVWRADRLRCTDAAIKFLSCEPLMGSLPSLNLNGIDWLIAGGESGPGSRPMKAEWVRDLRDQCTTAGTAFHFKQWGGVNKKQAGRCLDGRTWDEFPLAA